jgi:glutathione synthase/RimK-type ligase-like ATP-grasp enzyme
MKIAYLASVRTMPGSPVRRSDAFEHDDTLAALRPPLAAIGASLTDIAWDDPAAFTSGFDAAVIGTTWDYWDRAAEFVRTLERLEAQIPLFNASKTVRWNIQKTYLRDLAGRGARLIPTLWLDRVDEAAARAAFDQLDSQELVFKRQIGAGAHGQHKLKRGEPVPDMPHAMMVQPFLPMIQKEGELSFLFIGGEFSHALVKTAKEGDYRIQSSYGGTNRKINPSTEDLAAARAIMEAVEEPLLYARVDMLRGEDGRLYLMELEVIEPYLYPHEGAELGPLFAKALAKRLK